MDKEFMCRCPYCGHGNHLRYSDYHSYIEADYELKDICDVCGNTYGFEVELNFSTNVYLVD